MRWQSLLPLMIGAVGIQALRADCEATNSASSAHVHVHGCMVH